MSTTNNNYDIVEEEWTNPDGSNVFEDSFQKLKISKIENLFPGDEEMKRSLIFESFATLKMTPLDMTYGDDNNDEFYDGTGSLVWLASVAFCHLVSQNAIPQLSSPSLRAIELGCGCGLGGIATLLANQKSDMNVVFTDNDQEALDLSKRNCELNALSSKTYSLSLFPWGENPANYGLVEASFDVVLATDVVYDISMIPLLLQSASQLLRIGGYLVLCHVPRFCLSKDENSHSLQSSPQKELEEHILNESRKVDLVLETRIRPHQVLKNINVRKQEKGGEFDISLQHLEEAHAVLFVLAKQ